MEPGCFDISRGSDVYFCVNPLRKLVDSDTGEPAFHRRRTHVAAVRTIGMDMDHGGPAGLARLAEDLGGRRTTTDYYPEVPRSELPRGYVRRSVGSTHPPGTEDREQALAGSP